MKTCGYVLLGVLVGGGWLSTHSAMGHAATLGCTRAYPYSRTLERLVMVFARRHLTCSQAALVGNDVTILYVRNRIPIADYPPPPTGVPGGKGQRFSVSTRLGRFVCHMKARSSDSIAAACGRASRLIRFEGITDATRPGRSSVPRSL